MSEIDVIPILITETLYPVDLPEDVRPYLEASVTSHN